MLGFMMWLFYLPAFAYRFCVRPTEHVACLCRIHNSAHGIVNAAHVSNKISLPPHR